MTKNKKEYYLGNESGNCVICKAETTLHIMLRTNNVEYLDKAVINISEVDMDKCVRFVRAHKSILDDPALAEFHKSYTLPGMINDGKVTKRIGEYNYSTRSYPETTLWTGEEFKFPYPIKSRLALKALTKFKSDKAIKKAVVKQLENYNDRLSNRYASDHESVYPSCCSEECLNMWLLRS